MKKKRKYQIRCSIKCTAVLKSANGKSVGAQKPKIVCLAKDKYKFQKDLERMLNLEHTRGENYFDRMYRVLQFTFAALIAIAVFSFGKESPALSKMLMLKFVIPAFIYCIWYFVYI